MAALLLITHSRSPPTYKFSLPKQERKESNPRVLISSQPLSHSATFFSETLVKLLHFLVRAEWRVRPSRVSSFPSNMKLMAHPSQLGFQDAASPVIEELIHFHDHALIIVFLISTLVIYSIGTTVTTKLSNQSIIDSQEIEVV